MTETNSNYGVGAFNIMTKKGMYAIHPPERHEEAMERKKKFYNKERNYNQQG